MHNDLWSLALAADGAPRWTELRCAGRAPSARACHACCALPSSRGDGEQRLLVVGGLTPRWRARSMRPHVLSVPADDAAPLAWSQPRACGEAPCARAFHSTVALGGARAARDGAAGGEDAYAAVALVFGGGDGATARASNYGDLFVLRRVLWSPDLEQ